jgi:hypothetical protein
MFGIKQILLATAIAAVVVACGGGGSSASMTPPSGMAPAMVTGVITGFGSIYVNGTHFQTSSAVIRRNGQAVDQSKLAVGEVARVKGSKDDTGGTGVAAEVDVDESVIGPITGIDPSGMLTVLGQTVKVNGGTSFGKDIQPADITGLKSGDVIEVDGLIDSSGAIAATRIERASAGSPFQILGTVSNSDSTMHTFKINALIVDYSSANLSGFNNAAPSDGDAVEVQGTAFDTTTTTLKATQVTRQMSDAEEAGGQGDIEREGLITRFASATDFDVAGEPVTTTSTTEYRNGSASDLALNDKVEVEGTPNGSNVLVATVISFEHNGNIELEAPVTKIDTNAGTLMVLGVQVTVNANTRFEDDSSAEVAMFNLNNLSVGDTVKVHGYESPAGSGNVVATRLEREAPSTTVSVEGPFTAGTSPEFMVLGITIDPASMVTISDGHGGTLDLATFLAQAVGHVVKVQGMWSNNVVMASEIAIDDHNGDEN